MSEFDILYVSQNAIKGSVIADFLVERANEEYEPMSFDFPDEDLMAVLQIEEKESPEEEESPEEDRGGCTSTEHRMSWDVVEPS